MNARPVGTLAYTAEQMQDVRRRLQQAELQRDNALAALEASRADAERLAAALDEASRCRVLLSNHALAGSDWFPARQEASAKKTYDALSAHRALTGEVKS